MLSRLNVNLLLCTTAAVVTIAAIVAGLIVVGGPKPAREVYAADNTIQRVTGVLNIAQCVFDETGSTPERLTDAAAVSIPVGPDGGWPNCALGRSAKRIESLMSPDITTVGSAAYHALSTDRISICANFRRPSQPSDKIRCEEGLGYAALDQPHPAGRYCFEIQLVKGYGTAPPCLAGHAPHE